MRTGLFQCGPVTVDLSAPTAALFNKVAETLDLYMVRWTRPERRLSVQVTRTGRARTGGSWHLLDVRTDGRRALRGVDSCHLPIGRFGRLQ